MADIAIGVRGFLLSKSVITDLVGQRIYTDALPQSATLPAIVMEKLYTQHEHELSNLAGLAHARLQFSCFAATRLVSNSVAEAIRTSGVVTQKGSTSDVDIRGVRVEEGMSYQDDPPTDGSDERRYVSVIDLMVDFTETV